MTSIGNIYLEGLKERKANSYDQRYERKLASVFGLKVLSKVLGAHQ